MGKGRPGVPHREVAGTLVVAVVAVVAVLARAERHPASPDADRVGDHGGEGDLGLVVDVHSQQTGLTRRDRDRELGHHPNPPSHVGLEDLARGRQLGRDPGGHQLHPGIAAGRSPLGHAGCPPMLLDRPSRVGPEADGDASGQSPGDGNDVVDLQAWHGDHLHDLEGLQVDDGDLGPVVLVLAVGVAADQRPAPHDGEAPAEAANGHPSLCLAPVVQLDQRAVRRLAHVPSTIPPTGSVGVPQAGDDVDASDGVVHETKPLGLVPLPPAVAVEATEGTDVEPAVDHQEGVEVPRVRHPAALPHDPGCGTVLDPPDRPVPARADVHGLVVPAHVVGVTDLVEPLIAADALRVVGEQLTGGRLLARSPQDSPQAPATNRQAGGRQVVEGTRPTAGDVIDATAPLAEPADQHAPAVEGVLPGANHPHRR
jgi:hypothetical protein